jgi:F-type H+-transporting ATPase subunit gamma
MKTLNEIRQRIRAVEQTRKITNAMYLLATSRMRRAIAHSGYNHEYYLRVRGTVKGILARLENVRHPYLDHREAEGGRAAFIVVAGSQGMCGAYNHNVLDFAFDHIAQYPNRYLVTIGNVATRYFIKRGIAPDRDYSDVAHNPSLTDARNLVEEVFDGYDNGLMDEVFIISTRFINAATQTPRFVRLLPLEIEDYEDVYAEVDEDEDILFEPSAQEVFNTLVPQYAVGLVFGSLVQSVASEHCARMNAMQQATTNADAMLDQLRAKYNAARQFALTSEILEITSAAMAIGEDI